MNLDSSEMEGRLKSVWGEVREFWGRLQRGEATLDQDPQPQIAAEFFAYFLTNSDTKLGHKALVTAFMMWGNTANASAVTSALPHLDVNAAYWEGVLHSLINAYYRSGKDAIPVLHEYESRLTHPQSQSAISLLLGRHYLVSGNDDRAAGYFRKILTLDAKPRDVQEAEGSLYESAHLRIGQQAPHFECRTIDGDPIRLADLAGQVVCLDFWETTCGPCWGEFPTLRALHEEFASSRFQLLGVASDNDESALRRAMGEERLTWPQVREETGWDGERVVFGPLRKLYNVWGIPRSFVIDRTTRLAAKDLRGSNLIEAVRKLVT